MDKDGFILIDSDDDGNDDDITDKDSKFKYVVEDLNEILEFVDSKNWYSITIEDSSHSTVDILAGLLNSIAPLEFVPVLTESSERSLRKIYATQCEKAIKKITSLGFQFYCKNDLIHPIRIKVIHNDPPLKKINPIKIIHDALSLRFTKSIFKLDLTDFENDFLLRGKLYFPLWYSGNQRLITILIKALSLTPLIHVLDLSENSLTNISHLNIPFVFSNIHTLNLSKNNFKNLEAFKCFRGYALKIKTLNLDGNDLCLDFVGEQNYTMCVKMIFQSLTKLDDRVLSVSGLPSVKRNFTVDWDTIPFIDKFLEIYVTLFDSEQRERVCSMYSKSAVLTISGGPNSFVSSSRCRNILNALSVAKVAKVYHGFNNIRDCINSLAKTLHDPFSFRVDVVSHSSIFTMIHVQGVFKIPAETINEEEPVIEFMRTFILSNVGCAPNFYKITNDMFNLSSISTSSSMEAFKATPVSCNKLSLVNLEKYLTDSVMKEIVDIFIHYTQFPHSEALLYLQRNKWNLRAALLDVIPLFSE